jgi:riboflavin kinase/FMN adenylyltransferase
VHRGHQAIIGHAVKRAHDLGMQSVVMTFDPHPAEVVRPGSHPAVLTESVRKAELVEQLGVDALCVVPFTPAFSHLSAEAFVHDVLVEALHAAVVVVGDNFRFGHRAAGDVNALEYAGGRHGFEVVPVPLRAPEGETAEHRFSSTEVRRLIAEGRPAADVVFVGPCCESGDILTPAPGDPEALAPRRVPRPQVGDLVVVGGAGAYCAAMSTINYNSYPQAPEVMLEPDGTLRLLRRRQTLAQIWANEV